MTDAVLITPNRVPAMPRTTWVDRPGEPLAEGDFARVVRPFDVPTVYRVESLKDGWVVVHPVKADGTRDRRGQYGWSGLAAGLVKVVREPAG